MILSIPSFANGAGIPEQYAFGVIDKTNHVKLGLNRNPHIKWSDLPVNTGSLVLICVDTDVPSVGMDVNKEGRTISCDLPRVDFYHWLLANIDPNLQEILAGQAADGIVTGGKPTGKMALGLTGSNDYSKWFATDQEMRGEYGGYDGPCPPWNDELPHHYRFRLYALDVKELDLPKNFDGKILLEAMSSHIIEMQEWLGVYSLNPGLQIR